MSVTGNNNVLYHFPPLHEGDCIYDILSRYHEQSLHFKSPDTSKELFGGVLDLRPAITLPYRVERIHVWLGHDSGISPQTLRDHHSAWQYLQLSDEFSSEVLAPITRADTKPGRRKQTRMRLVLQRSLGRLRYCPLCLIRDALTVREPFWHQVHQLYGVKYCPVHCIPLQDSDISIEKPLYHYVPASTLLAGSSTTKLMGEASCLEGQPDPYKKPYIALAKTISWLVAHGAELGSGREVERYYKKTALGNNEEAPLEGKKLVALMTSVGGMGFLEDLFDRERLEEAIGGIMNGGVSALLPLDHALVMTALQTQTEWERQH